MKIDSLALLSGVDLPYPSARLSVHQPTLKEIAFMGEKNFYTACNILRLTPANFGLEGKIDLNEISNFNIIMSIINAKTLDGVHSKQLLLTLLFILFPNYKISISPDAILLKKENSLDDSDEPSEENQSEDEYRIDSKNFDDLVNIVSVMCCLQKPSETYDPAGSLSKKIADKLKKGRHKAAAAKGKSSDEDVSMLEREVSILTTGQQLEIAEVLNYTLYQLSDAFTRFELKMNYDVYLSAKMAGATGMKEVDNWMKNIHNE